MTARLPVVVIGAGPVGLAAAAHLAVRGEAKVILEAGSSAGASVLKWGHVRLFSPWRYVVDSASRQLLERGGWAAPLPDAFPTGQQVVDGYLRPLAATREIEPDLHFSAKVLSISRVAFDKMKTAGRDAAPFLVRYERGGVEEAVLARAVIDASGTWQNPNPLGSDGTAAPGETALARKIFYGIPDVLRADRARFTGKRVLVVGSGHSAFNALLELHELAIVTWAIRRPALGNLFGGQEKDALLERDKLGSRVREMVEQGGVRLLVGFNIASITAQAGTVVVTAASGQRIEVDEIVSTTGFRPDLSMTRELRLGLDSALESPAALAPLIDPNVHSCGTVPPHGAQQLAHPEKDFYVVGMKSYGRAPTFLMLTGYEQVRSVVAALCGDWEAARKVELVLPETGVCSIDRSALETSNCCTTRT